jgi:hypothetical protein
MQQQQSPLFTLVLKPVVHCQRLKVLQVVQVFN